MPYSHTPTFDSYSFCAQVLGLIVALALLTLNAKAYLRDT